MKAGTALAVFAALLGAACERGEDGLTPAPGGGVRPAGGDPPGAPSSAPPSAPSTAPSTAPPKAEVPLPTFRDVAEEAGLVVVNHTGKSEKKDWIVSGMGGGAIWFDHDVDGDMDLLVVDGTMLTEAGVLEYSDDARTRLFRNESTREGPRFRDVTKEAGIDIRAFGFGGAACDYDADGFPDVYVCCWGPSFLLRNRGDGTFEDVTAKAGVGGGGTDMSTACAWGDVNGDGIHDLYVANYLDQQAVIDEFAKAGRKGRSTKWRENAVYVGPQGLPAQKDRLFLGNGDGTFRDVTETALRGQQARYGFQPVMSDLDDDGDLDVFVANDTQANHLWMNDGSGVFRDVASGAGCATSRDDAEQACMGVDVADVNRDGWLDLTVTNFSHDYNTIYLNKTRRAADGRTSPLTFTDSSHALGIAEPSYLRLSWGVRMLDYDNDGELDHVSACGHVYGEIDGFEAKTGTSYRQRCQILRNTGPTSYRLVDVTDTSGPAFQVKRVWRGMTFADFDDDGDQDFFVAALNDKGALFLNEGGDRNAWLRFRLEGKGGLRDPSGVRVSVHRADGKVMLEELHHGATFCGDNDPRLFFGCGSAERMAKVEVRWPDGTRQEFRDVATRRAYRVKQGREDLVPDPPVSR